MTKHIKIYQKKSTDLTPNDLIYISELITLIEFLTNEYIQHSNKFTKGKYLDIEARKNLIGVEKIKICSINKNSPLEICLLFEYGFAISEILDLVFSKNFYERLIEFYEKHIYCKKITEVKRVEIYQKFTKWNSALKVVKGLFLFYKIVDCMNKN